jgi:hypothetical protein
VPTWAMQGAWLFICSAPHDEFQCLGSEMGEGLIVHILQAMKRRRPTRHELVPWAAHAAEKLKTES